MSFNIIVDCTWPCPGGTDHACILTNSSIQCQQKHNSQWIWNDPTSAPQYDGEPARLHQPCITAPVPQLTPFFNNNNLTTVNATQTVVTWPPMDLYRPVDAYLSDCGSHYFCHQGTCISKLKSGQSCVSSHQCSSVCNNNVCQDDDPLPPAVTTPSPQQQDQQQQQDNTEHDGPWAKPDFTTGHLIGVIIAVIVLICAIVLFFLYKRKTRPTTTTTTKPKPTLPKTLQDVDNSLPTPPTASHLSTPSMQQHQLQLQLQRQLPSSLSCPSPSSIPPPYSP
ncbi:uncharacterized protein BX664DRAFT_386241 [Halteromyces radiatus]|uniref:uncharacterized protein n=1 Tax=Halteromyces radiatus TaxID=101107 RepID=UPI00221F4FB7|nr:uncharacterized protein BX664DRAFT_386241 [Halteromyces radiatus]KAI8089821.1 hypothetical protein BX664DRAFT_386241 [Halteromyces radiatus]